MLTNESRTRDFPSLGEMTYLNTAAEGIPPLGVGEALSEYYRDAQLGMDGREAHFAQLAALRELAGRMYGLSAAEIGVCSCTSEAYNLAALALRLQPGDEVVVNDLDFPSGVTPWTQPACPATVKVWRSREGALRVEDLAPLLGPRTRLVTASLVSFYNGFKISPPSVAEAVHQGSPALLAVDVTQALGRVPLDCAAADLLVSSTHKWLLGSHGGCLVGVPKARAEAWTVAAGGWHNLQDAFGPDRFYRAAESLAGAAGFMVGMPNFAAVYAVRAALDYILGVGVAEIEKAADPLAASCLEGLGQLPVKLLTPAAPGHLAGIIAFTHPETERLGRLLHEDNIHVMSHAGRIRVALHGYNTPADVERFLTSLAKTLAA